ncbi:MAG: SDR family NAD(P)-dependent oxidoreductase [Campylobacteraceae bacterium]|jgi:nucleoside-diphosphate-sugar epimerase|nr:SDR family NAD(P)-dependent oxidoreductase [Campylobacteraceae bacterium]
MLSKNKKNEIHPIIKEDIKNILSEPLPWSDLQNKTVLITGATGLIPGYIVHTLMSIEGVHVVALSRSEEKLKQKFSMYANNPYFTYLAYDMSVTSDFTKLFNETKIDIIFHGAGNTDNIGQQDIVNTIDINTYGTKSCLDFLKIQGSGVFIPFSSATIYGLSSVLKVSETDYGYTDLQANDAPYVQSKRTLEVYSYAYNKQFNVNIRIPRISWVIGPEMNRQNGMRTDFLYNLLDGQDMIIKSDGKRVLPFCYISDVITALFYIFFYGKQGEPYNIVADDGNISVKQFAEIHKSILNIQSNLIIKNEYSDGKPGIMMDNSKLHSLGWKSKITISDGLQRIYNYMLSKDK